MIDENYTDMTPRAFATQVIDRLNAKFDLRLHDIINNHALTTEQKRRLLTSQLLEALLARIDEHDRLAGIVAPLTAHDARFTAGLKDTDIELEPNIALSEHNAKIICGYQGDELYNYLFTLTKRFENMAAAKTTGQLAIEIVSGGMLSVGVPMAFYTIKALRAGAALLSALKTGITNVGMKTAMVAVAVILVALLLYLFLENPKKILGMIVNNTDDDLVVKDWRKGVHGGAGGDLHMEHGYIESFPEDHETGDLDSPLVQVRKRFFFAPDDPDNAVFAGIYFGDRNFGLRGVEGIMLLSSKTTSLCVAHQFAVPYTNDNGTNIRLLKEPPKSLPELFRDMYNSRKVRVDTTDGGYRMTSTVNSARGGVVGLITSITKT